MKTKTENLNELNTLLNKFEPEYRQTVISIIESDVIRSDTDWCSPADYNNDPDIAIFIQMVELLEVLSNIEFNGCEYISIN